MQNILIIEDEKRVADLLQKGLEENGYQTMVAYDGAMGLRLFRSNSFHLVISDIVLPNLDGFELCKEIRKFFLAYTSLKPIRDITREAENITALYIDKRLPVKNEKDELGELCMTFNDLLERLEVSFQSQKMFVSNVSHELRTPLATLIAELDLLHGIKCSQRIGYRNRPGYRKPYLSRNNCQKHFRTSCRHSL